MNYRGSNEPTVNVAPQANPPLALQPVSVSGERHFRFAPKATVSHPEAGRR